MAPSLTPDHHDKVGRTLFGPTEGNSKTKGKEGKEEWLDIGIHVEAH